MKVEIPKVMDTDMVIHMTSHLMMDMEAMLPHMDEVVGPVMVMDHLMAVVVILQDVVVVVLGGYLGMIKALRVASGGEGTVIKVCLVDPTGEEDQPKPSQAKPRQAEPSLSLSRSLYGNPPYYGFAFRTFNQRLACFASFFTNLPNNLTLFNGMLLPFQSLS